MYNTKKRYYILFLILLANVANQVYSFSTYSLWGHDPYPRYSTLDPHEFLYRRYRERLKGWLEEEDGKERDERFALSITPFMQSSDRGKTISNETAFLGDIPGRWNMLALLFGETPENCTLPPSLQTAKDEIFKNIDLTPEDEELYVDPCQVFGFFSVPLKYCKRGVRFQADFRIVNDFGAYIQCGFADINQCLENPCRLPTFCGCTCDSMCPPTVNSDGEIEQNPTCGNACSDQTCQSTGKPLCSTVDQLPVDLTPCYSSDNFPNSHVDSSLQITKSDVETYLMKRLYTIAREICFDLCCFNKCYVEDIHFNFFWRHAFDITPGREACENHFLVIPYLVARFTAATGQIRCPWQAFGLSFGNNGHNGIGVKGGINIDFAETVEVGGEVGIMHFLPKTFCDYRVPNSIFQSGIYPFSTNVRIEPGLNCHIALKLAAYHFLGCLSGYFQYVAIVHNKDKICLCNSDPAFQPCLLECISDWKTQVANIGFNYDISPNISLGFLWQAPLSQRRAYRSSTVMFGFNVTY